MNRVEKCATDVLRDHEINCLPISAKNLALSLDYNIITYSKAKRLIKELKLENEIANKKGFSVKIRNKYYIFLSDCLSAQEEQEVIVHEIGHIKLHFTDDLQIIGSSNDSHKNAYQESEAREFSKRILAPLPVLHQLNIKVPEEIVSICNVSHEYAKEIYLDLIAYDDEYCDELKRCDVQSRFSKFIRKSNFSVKKKRFITIAIVAAALCAVFCASAVFLLFRQDSAPYFPGISSDEIQSKPPTSSTLDLANATYYWTSNGEVYHLFSDCQSLKKSASIHSGSLDEAVKAKDRLCSFCNYRLTENE